MQTISLSPDMQSRETRAVFAALEAKGGVACVRFVGGCVRNALMGRPVSDLDLATQLTPDETEAALKTAGIKSVPTGKGFGTITAIYGDTLFEITSLREDVETDGRRSVVSFTTDWARDALRRDFYLNALYVDGQGRVYDPTGQGVADVQNGRVRFIGEAEQRIREDYLRILRFFRFSAGYAKAIDAESLAACVALKDGIDGLSGERIQQEVLKMLALPAPVSAFEAMQGHAILPHIITGWPPSGTLSTFSHMCSLSADPELRLMALLDDGVGLAAPVLTALRNRLKLSKRLSERLNAAGQVADALASDQTMPFARLIYLFGREATEDALCLVAAHQAKPIAAVQYVLAMIEGLKVPVFPLKGADLIAHGMKAGPEVGKRLKQIETEWLEHDFSQSVIDRALDAGAK
ncbi:MAG: CCA tRNA nucleotidyltransferase [Asticcacaulis sp.]